MISVNCYLYESKMTQRFGFVMSNIKTVSITALIKFLNLFTKSMDAVASIKWTTTTEEKRKMNSIEYTIRGLKGARGKYANDPQSVAKIDKAIAHQHAKLRQIQSGQ